MITYRTGDATDPTGTGKKLIAHVCNDVGVWGAGFTGALDARWPSLGKDFCLLCKAHPVELGDTLFLLAERSIWTANMVAQHGVGRQERRLRYDMLETCLLDVNSVAVKHKFSVHMPRIGTGLAGGEWAEIEKIIQRTLKVDVTVYDLKG